MAFSTQREDSDGTLVLLDISIEYFDRSEIAVFFDGVLSTSWSWVGSTEKKISFSPAVPNGVGVMVVRSTDLSELRHMFSAGAAFTTQSLDEALLQILHIAQEARENATIEEVFHNLNMHGYRIVNVGPGVDATDGANMAQMDAAVGVALAAAEAAASSAATINVANLLAKANNLSDLQSASSARANLGLGSAALVNVANLLAKADNLSDLQSASSARANLGLGSAALVNVGTANGNVPAVQPDGKLPSSVLPAVASTFPSGGIIMWPGSIASIPSGWLLCDGTNATPDMSDWFIIAGAGADAMAYIMKV